MYLAIDCSFQRIRKEFSIYRIILCSFDAQTVNSTNATALKSYETKHLVLT